MSVLIERDLAYTAGIIDGEGSICTLTSSDTFSVRVSIGNTNEALINWLGRSFHAKPSLYSKGNDKRKPRWSVCWDGPKAYSFLKLVLPFVRMKKQQARIAMSYQEALRAFKERHGVRKFYRTPVGFLLFQKLVRDKLQRLNASGQAWQ